MIQVNLYAQIDLMKHTQVVLKHVDNYRTVIDNRNVVWICSENGLTRFNFKNSKYFQISDGLPTNDIWQLYPDNSDRMWLFHKEKGVYFIRNDSIQLIKGTEKLRETFVIAEFSDTIFLKSFGYYDQNNINPNFYYYTKDGKFGECDLTKTSKLKLFHQDLNMKISLSGVQFYTDVQGNRFHEYRSFSYGNVFKDKVPKLLFLQPKNPEIYFISEESIVIQSIKQIIGAPVQQSIFFKNSKACIIEVNNSIRYYTNIALNQRDFKMERILEPFYKTCGLNFNFSKDKEGNIWITIHRGGVYFIPKSYYDLISFDLLTKQTKEFSERNFIHLSVIGNYLYAFSRNSIIQEINIATGEKKTLGSSKDLKDVKTRGSLIAWSNNDGITVHNSQTGNTKKLSNGQRVVAFDFFDPNTLYSNTGDAFLINSGEIKPQLKTKGDIDHLVITSNACLSWENNVITVTEIRNNSNKIQQKYPIKNVINAERIADNLVCFYIENDGCLLFDATGKTIAHKYRGKSIKKAFVYKNYFFAVSHQNVYYSTIDKKGLIAKDFHTYHTFLERTNSSIQAVAVHKNTLILGMNNGINSYIIEDIIGYKATKPSLSLNSITVNNQLLKDSDHLKYTDKDFSFKFNAYAYGNYGEVTLNYKLTGLDNKWYTVNSNQINFTTIPPGEYVLYVYAYVDGRISNTIQYHFTIPIPFWKSIPFLTGVFLLFIFLVFKGFQTVFKYRAKVYERKNLLMELEFKALKAQLNPHFIFNSLNSLQTVIHRKSEIEANEYIVSFSRLMRTILDNSRVLSISLNDEIDFLRNFVFLYNQKIDDPILFEVSMGNVKNPAEIFIRNMIIQPFIENAILHGFANFNGLKRIQMNFEITNQILFITIIDNGVGRKAASIFNKTRTTKHTSLSTTILKEKSRLLKEMNLEELNFVITDLYQNEEPIGTKVVISMRVFENSTSLTR